MKICKVYSLVCLLLSNSILTKTGITDLKLWLIHFLLLTGPVIIVKILGRIIIALLILVVGVFCQGILDNSWAVQDLSETIHCKSFFFSSEVPKSSLNHCKACWEECTCRVYSLHRSKKMQCAFCSNHSIITRKLVTE